MSVICYYEDYDNAPWDSEVKDYVFVDTIKMRENHHARFACRIGLDRETKTIKVYPFTVILGGDSRKERYKIEEHDYEQELQDMDREAIGFNPLGSYETYLEEDLPNSDMSKELTKRFEKVNALHCSFEPFCISYDSLLERLCDTEHAEKIIKLISKSLMEISDFPGVIDEDNINADEIELIKRWAEAKGESAAGIAEECSLPDVLNYGETIAIKGVDGSELILSTDEIVISPIEGGEECIDICLLSGQEKIARGCVKLTVGYLNFNEDGTASDGIEDSIEYDYLEIAEKIDNYILEQSQKLANESKIVEIIESAVSGLI